MRAAVIHAYYELTGEYPDFVFSGWGDTLTDSEQAALERHAEIREMAMAEPKTELDHRLDRMELAISTMASWLVQAQTGFNSKDAQGIERILAGGHLEGAEADERLKSHVHYPAAERQEEPGS